MMTVLQIGADRSKRGILFPNSPAFKRQEAYGKELGHLDIIGFSRKTDGAKNIEAQELSVYPTNSTSRLLYGWDTFLLARKLQKIDVVSVQDPFETGIVGWLIAKYFGVPLHVQIHTDVFAPAYAKHSILNRLRTVIAGFVLRRAQGIRVVSERIKKSLEARGDIRAHISVLPIFVDIGSLRGAADPSVASRFSAFPMRLLVASRLEPEKNVQLAIEAFVTSAPKNACLIIVGDGSEKNRLQKLAAHHGVSNRIFFEGEHDASPYFIFVDLVLVTSTYEGYGLVTIEALAAGKPVLSTDVGIAREVGAIIAPEAEFADALATWLADGPRSMQLRGYPYGNFDEYVRAYSGDIKACKKG